MYYNYEEEMKKDIIEYFGDEIRTALSEDSETDDVYWDFYDRFWVEDCITGNASGSYYCNAYKAMEAVQGNEDIISDCILEFCIEPETVAEHLFDYEYWDVTARCYMLSSALQSAIEELQTA